MSPPGHPLARLKPNLPFVLLAILLGFLWLAGGASRADVMGQAIVRSVAWTIMIAAVLFGPRPRLGDAKPVAAFLFAATALAALHLVPLPPNLWAELPGRDLLTRASVVIGEQQPWRPLSISPGATLNALSSLIVPIATLLLAASLSRAEHWRTAALVLALVIASSLLGFLQFSGVRFDHPLINDVAGSVSASFANRNHFALFAAIGCILAPGLAFREKHRALWKHFAALALIILFALIILATGSRTGLLVGIFGIAIGILNVRRQMISELRRLPRKWSIALASTALALLAAAVALSVTLDRAVSLDRAFALEAGEDLRLRALPVIVQMTQFYFPAGSGIGGFDPVYRIHEPGDLLGIAYLNHAHNDLLEIVLDAGLPGLVLLLAAIVWWLWKSAGVWARMSDSEGKLPRMGSGILLLILIASLTDYAARTPMIMTVIVLAALWLNMGSQESSPASASARRSA